MSNPKPEDLGRHTFTFLPKRYNVVLSLRTTRVRVPLARNPSPLQYPTLHVEKLSVRSLLRQPRSALEARPSQVHTMSFVHTSRPHLHPNGCTFSSFFCHYEENNGLNTNWAEASSIFFSRIENEPKSLDTTYPQAVHSASPAPLTEEGPLGALMRIRSNLPTLAVRLDILHI